LMTNLALKLPILFQGPDKRLNRSEVRVEVL